MKVRAKYLYGYEDDENYTPKVIGWIGEQRVREGDIIEIPDEPFPMLDRHGNQVMRVVRDGHGKKLLNEDGSPKMEPITIHPFSEKWMEKIDEKEYAKKHGEKALKENKKPDRGRKFGNESGPRVLI